jgi:apolipoprotein N-acyltransferase
MIFIFNEFKMTIKNKPYYLLLLSILSGFIFWLGWPTKPFPLLLFFAFIPILKIEEFLSESTRKKKGGKFFCYAYIALLLWNVLVTYWVYNSSAVGGIFAMFANALLMSIPLMLFFYTKKLTNQTIGLISFIIYWLAFEYIHLNWQLSWPWLTLGNAFSSIPSMVQWYEYTGVFGGSLWILAANVILFRLPVMKASILKKSVLCFSLFLPAVFSIFIYSNYHDQGKDIEVVVVQPNIDPFEEKFRGTSRFIPYEKQLERLISLSRKKIGPHTKYIVWPETALPFGYNEGSLEKEAIIQTLKDFVKEYKNITLITGLDTYKIYLKKETSTAKPTGDNYHFYDSYNAALQITEDMRMEVYHKSRLVPGVEYVPNFLSPFVIDLGGGSGILGSQEDRTVFYNNEHLGVAPIICYESIFGDFVRAYVNNGANLLFIITNDGWWGNTQGYQQHLQYARLRAIETRKCIARSANTGVSGYINQRGDIFAKSAYWKQAVMKSFIKENNIKTFYVEHGDYIGIFALYLSGALILLVIGIRVKRSKSNTHP